MRRISAVAALCAAAVMASGCASTVVVGRPSAAESTVVAAAAPSPSAAANRAVCVDLDARGGSLYALFVVPMMAGPTGQTSVSVDASSMARATTALVGLGASSLDGASGDIRDHGERLSASAGAMGIHDDVEGTAVLTSFVSLAVACQVAGHRPSWFDAEALAR